ncbi:MAG TPA: hypothetical protein VFA26_05420 [Gemmataceae bacterium]|nr:hypothetical protein [Gemmataceae bacterium]
MSHVRWVGVSALAVLFLAGAAAVAQPPYPPPPVEPPPVVTAPPPQAVLPGPVRPLTLQEFACSFRPCPGPQEVMVIHPFTGCPVKVCFCLPAGCPKVKVSGCLRKRVEFKYGRCEVEIVFFRDGRVKVRNG